MEITGRRAKLLDFFRAYTGKTAVLLCENSLRRAEIQDLDEATQTEIVTLTEQITEYVLEPMLSKGRLAKARTDLVTVLSAEVEATGIPQFIDGVRVLPQDIESRLIKKYKSVSEFVLAQEMKRYGLKGMADTSSAMRKKILLAFVEHHFGHSGLAIISEKMDEFRMKDMNKSPVYNKLILMEYILQSMLYFYIKPTKARFLRSELVSIMGIDVRIVQGGKREEDAIIARRYVREHLAAKGTDHSRQRTRIEDMIAFSVRQSLRKRGFTGGQVPEPDVRAKMLEEIVLALLGSMAEAVLEAQMTDDVRVKTKFYMRYLADYLDTILPEADADIIRKRVERGLGVSFILTL